MKMNQNQKKLPLSLVVITKNEESRLARCLRSASFVEDQVVLDSGSTDGTLKVAADFGARVFEAPWQGFGLQRRQAVELAKFDWVLCLDADEACDEVLAEELINKFSQLNPKTAYRFRRRSFHLGRWIRHGGWYPDWQIRLFHRSHSQWSESPIHEKVQASQVEDLSGNLLHWVFEDLAHQIQTNNRYSSLQAEKLFIKGKRARLDHLLIKPWVKFIECYFFKMGFLDGLPGFIIAVGAGYSVFLKWAKLWEKQLGKQINKREV